MNRKRITQIFPWMLPIRKIQKKMFFYLKMKFDRNHYSNIKSEFMFPNLLFETSSAIFNEKTGFEMIYQKNKKYNLELAAKTVNGIMIYPHETFSFWKLVRYADKHESYKEGLVVINDELTTERGGGLCQLSNLLFWMFLHTPLTIIERHGHTIKKFPDPPGNAVIGVDAAVSEGWLDLKVRNDTESIFQINIAFGENNIIGQIFVNEDIGKTYIVTNGEPVYYKENQKIYEKVDIIQNVFLSESGECESGKVLYVNLCEIGYQLSETIKINEKCE